jgi:hypothetical protein
MRSMLKGAATHAMLWVAPSCVAARRNPPPSSFAAPRLRRTCTQTHRNLWRRWATSLRSVEEEPLRLAPYFGCGTIRKYGFGDFQPPG